MESLSISKISARRFILGRQGLWPGRRSSGKDGTNDYRGRKDSALALFYLWLTGELMIHHRENFQRVYDFRDNIAPRHLNVAATEEEADNFFARKATAYQVLIRGAKWGSSFSGIIERPVSRAEAQQWLARLTEQGTFSNTSGKSTSQLSELYSLILTSYVSRTGCAVKNFAAPASA